MKKILIGFGITMSIILGVLLIGGMGVWSSRNKAVSMEERLNAQYASNKSNYDSMWKKFTEMTQVTEIQAKQFKEVYTGLISGRYNDQTTLFKMVHENNPNLNVDVYTELQREISAGRNQFDNNQKQIADIVREYNTYVRKHIIMTAITGRKTKDINDFIVTSEKTTKAFDSKKDDSINLLGK